jgi:hypothetical protein
MTLAASAMGSLECVKGKVSCIASRQRLDTRRSLFFITSHFPFAHLFFLKRIRTRNAKTKSANSSPVDHILPGAEIQQSMIQIKHLDVTRVET